LKAEIAHRDIKAENIVLNESAHGITIKLCDFGLARSLGADSVSYSFCGTFPFMSPEMISGSAYRPVPTDVWSMGMVITEVCCNTNVILKAASVHKARPTSNDEQKATLTKISEFLAQENSVCNMLSEEMRPELADLNESPVVALLEGMLTVSVSERFTAKSLVWL